MRETGLTLSQSLGDRPPIHLIWDELTANIGRLKLISKNVVEEEMKEHPSEKIMYVLGF